MGSKLSVHSMDSMPIIELPTSKSESNRWLILQAISSNKFEIEKLSEAKDTVLLRNALGSKETIINVGMAGTAYRFLTAYYAVQKGRKTILIGADRMNERPIGVLVDALRQLGAEIVYLGKEGFPPLQIHGKKLDGGQLTMDGSISSQFISAILLIAPNLLSPLKLELKNLVSQPYIDLTLSLMQQVGVEVVKENDNIIVHPSITNTSQKVEIEADWSSAAFFYELMAIAEIPKMEIMGLKEKSFQGDKKLVEVFQHFGIKTTFSANGIVLTKVKRSTTALSMDLKNYPDLIPSVAVTAGVLKIPLQIVGVASLRIKESDRVEALQKELKKINILIEEEGEDSIRIKTTAKPPSKVSFKTYNDHRIAMCLAPLAFLIEEVEIEKPEVVEKSFPDFWKQMQSCGLQIITD